MYILYHQKLDYQHIYTCKILYLLKVYIFHFQTLSIHQVHHIKFINNKNRTIRIFRTEIFETMRQDAIAKAVDGVTTIGEVLRATQDTDGDF